MEPISGRAGCGTSGADGSKARGHDISIRAAKHCRTGSLHPSLTRNHLLNTFQNIVKLQDKKRNLAKYTLGTKSDESISDAVQVRFL